MEGEILSSDQITIGSKKRNSHDQASWNPGQDAVEGSASYGSEDIPSHNGFRTDTSPRSRTFPDREAAGRQTPQPNESRSLDHSGRRRHSIEGNSRDAESSDPDTSGKPRQKRISNRNRTRRSRKIIHQMAQARFSDGGTMVRFCLSE